MKRQFHKMLNNNLNYKVISFDREDNFVSILQTPTVTIHFGRKGSPGVTKDVSE